MKPYNDPEAQLDCKDGEIEYTGPDYHPNLQFTATSNIRDRWLNVEPGERTIKTAGRYFFWWGTHSLYVLEWFFIAQRGMLWL